MVESTQSLHGDIFYIIGAQTDLSDVFFSKMKGLGRGRRVSVNFSISFIFGSLQGLLPCSVLNSS